MKNRRILFYDTRMFRRLSLFEESFQFLFNQREILLANDIERVQSEINSAIEQEISDITIFLLITSPDLDYCKKLQLFLEKYQDITLQSIFLWNNSPVNPAPNEFVQQFQKVQEFQNRLSSNEHLWVNAPFVIIDRIFQNQQLDETDLVFAIYNLVQLILVKGNTIRLNSNEPLLAVSRGFKIQLEAFKHLSISALRNKIHNYRTNDYGKLPEFTMPETVHSGTAYLQLSNDTRVRLQLGDTPEKSDVNEDYAPWINRLKTKFNIRKQKKNIDLVLDDGSLPNLKKIFNRFTGEVANYTKNYGGLNNIKKIINLLHHKINEVQKNRVKQEDYIRLFSDEFKFHYFSKGKGQPLYLMGERLRRSKKYLSYLPGLFIGVALFTILAIYIISNFISLTIALKFLPWIIIIGTILSAIVFYFIRLNRIKSIKNQIHSYFNEKFHDPIRRHKSLWLLWRENVYANYQILKRIYSVKSYLEALINELNVLINTIDSTLDKADFAYNSFEKSRVITVFTDKRQIDLTNGEIPLSSEKIIHEVFEEYWKNRSQSTIRDILRKVIMMYEEKFNLLTAPYFTWEDYSESIYEKMFSGKERTEKQLGPPLYTGFEKVREFYVSPKPYMGKIGINDKKGVIWKNNMGYSFHIIFLRLDQK